jgi:hypothetical protein
MRSTWKVFRPFLIAVLFGVPSLAQTSPTQPPVRDAEAIATFERSVVAMGGASAVGAIEDVTVEGTEGDFANSDAPPSQFTWSSSGAEFRSTAESSRGTYVAVSGHGSPAQQKNGQWRPLPYHVARACQSYYVPVIVLAAEIKQPLYTLRYLGMATTAGVAAIHIQSVDTSDRLSALVTTQDWYFDPRTFLPLRVEYILPHEFDASRGTTIAVNFQQFRTQRVAGLLVPELLKVQMFSASAVVTITSVSFNTSPNPSMFDPPSGGVR